MPNIFRTRRPTSWYTTQTDHDDPQQRQPPWPPRSKVNVTRSRDASDRCWPISQERNVLDRPKLVGRLCTSRATWPIVNNIWHIKKKENSMKRTQTWQTDRRKHRLHIIILYSVQNATLQPKSYCRYISSSLIRFNISSFETLSVHFNLQQSIR